MKTVRLHGKRDIRVHEELRPEPSAAEPLVRVTAVGLCGSDRHWYLEGGIGESIVEQPVVLGHESAGVIETGQRAGQRVAIEPSVACLSCEPCRTGNPNLCVRVRYPGHGATQGSLREFVTWPEDCLYRVPDSMSDEETALIEPLAIALHAIDLGKVGPGTSVGVFGCGPIGLLLISLLEIAGSTDIIATDPLPHRAAAAQQLGAVALQTEGIGEAGEWETAVRGSGVDIAFEVAGTDAALDAAIQAIKPGGRVVLVGIPEGGRTSFNASTARSKGLTFLVARRSRPIFERVIRLVERHGLDVGWLVTERFPLHRADEAFEALAERRGLKVMIKPTVTPVGAA